MRRAGENQEEQLKLGKKDIERTLSVTWTNVVLEYNAFSRICWTKYTVFQLVFFCRWPRPGSERSDTKLKVGTHISVIPRRQFAFSSLGLPTRPGFLENVKKCYLSKNVEPGLTAVVNSLSFPLFQ